MKTVKMVALLACISRNVRPLTKLMATAFAPPPPRVGSVARRWDSPPFGSLHFLHGKSSTRPVSLAIRATRGHTRNNGYGTSSSFAKLHSTIPNDNDAVATADSFVEEVDPYSDQAKDELEKFFERNGIDDIDVVNAHDSLLRLTEQVLSWNQKLNLVSRKDCTAAVVYHRHVLPSVALLPLILETIDSEKEAPLNIIDVGTGGGFPGLPLAVLLPDARFTLVDSVQKKLRAVGEMAADLDVSNVRVHWGRVEEMYVGEKGRREHFGRYDAVLGRSVTALPRFCGWVSDLLAKEDVERERPGGRLIYIIGGELDELVESRIVMDVPLDRMLQRPGGTSDKRALVFHAKDVEEIANESGEKDKIVRSGPVKKKNQNKGGRKMAKGAWSKKQNDVKKQRGYDNFQRYES